MTLPENLTFTSDDFLAASQELDDHGYTMDLASADGRGGAGFHRLAAMMAHAADTEMAYDDLYRAHFGVRRWEDVAS